MEVERADVRRSLDDLARLCGRVRITQNDGGSVREKGKSPTLLRVLMRVEAVPHQTRACLLVERATGKELASPRQHKVCMVCMQSWAAASVGGRILLMQSPDVPMFM
jgi:hypothetical protein